MGKTAYSGPVYGAKSLLWCFGPYNDLHSSGATTGLLTPNSLRTIPPYEDWMITEMTFSASTNSSVAAGHGVYLKSEGGNTSIIPVNQVGNGSTRANTIFSLVNAAGSTTWSTWATATADAGEYEGQWVPAGSTLRIVTSGVTLLGNAQVNIYGYIRFRNSTRAE
jgi:hypothetical protein